MATVHTSEIVSVWTEEGRPVRLAWRGDRFLVTDIPTPLREPFDHDALAHSPQPIIGWRLQGRSVSDGDTWVFDAREVAGTRWELTGMYR